MWSSVRLGDAVVSMQSGFASRPSSSGVGLPHLRPNNISREGRLDLTSLKHVAATNTQSTTYALQEGDVLFNNTNSPELVGKATHVDDIGAALFSNHMTRIRVRLEALDPRYTARYLHWCWAQGHFRGLVTQWVSQAAIGHQALGSVQVPLPSLSEQRRIADMLDEADKLRMLRAEADENSTALLPALFRQTFGDPATNPKGWGTTTIGERLKKCKGALQSGPFGSHLHNSDFTDDGDVLAVGIDNVLDGEFVLGRNRRITEEKYEALQKFTLHRGDVLLTIMGTVGRSCVFPDDAPKAICTKHVYRIQLDDQVEPHYVSALFRLSQHIRGQLRSRSTGQIVAGLKSSDLRTLQFPLPPRPLQDKFADLEAQLARLRDRQREASDQLERLFASLLHRTFSGELTARWREAHMKELLQEMEQQARILGRPLEAPA